MSTFSNPIIQGRLTRAALKYSIDIAGYNDKSKYPFINYQPITQLSEQALEVDSNTKYNVMPQLAKINDLKEYRTTRAASRSDLVSNDQCVVENIKINNSVKCVKIAYNGCSIDNGVIIAMHGGGFASGSAALDHYQCVSKYSGCVVISVDYTLVPEGSIEDILSDVVAVYGYFVNYYKNRNESGKPKIALTGTSAGGTLVLLTLLRLRDNRDTLKLPMPACVWVVSSWIDLTQSRSPQCYKYNEEYDCIVSKEFMDWTAQFVIDNERSKDENKDNSGLTLLNKYTALNDNFDGIECPMYFMVGATEVLLDDSIMMAKKIYDNKNIKSEVIVDLEPFLWHGWQRFGCPESTMAIVKGTQWVLKYFNNTQQISSKL